jgi:hypothetical protein
MSRGSSFGATPMAVSASLYFKLHNNFLEAVLVKVARPRGLEVQRSALSREGACSTGLNPGNLSSSHHLLQLYFT